MLNENQCSYFKHDFCLFYELKDDERHIDVLNPEHSFKTHNFIIDYLALHQIKLIIMQVPYITSNLNNSSKTWRWLAFIFCTFRKITTYIIAYYNFVLSIPTHKISASNRSCVSLPKKRNILSWVFEKQSTHPEAPSFLSANDVPVWVKHSLDKYSLQYLACRYPSLHIIWHSEMWFAACISKESHHLVPLRCIRWHTASLDTHISSSDT